ncbi:hypothetical protein BDW62DRAFT_198682 [Aspergillus aurantiobrunneus]
MWARANLGEATGKECAFGADPCPFIGRGLTRFLSSGVQANSNAGGQPRRKFECLAPFGKKGRRESWAGSCQTGPVQAGVAGHCLFKEVLQRHTASGTQEDAGRISGDRIQTSKSDVVTGEPRGRGLEKRCVGMSHGLKKRTFKDIPRLLGIGSSANQEPLSGRS